MQGAEMVAILECSSANGLLLACSLNILCRQKQAINYFLNYIGSGYKDGACD